MFPVLSSSPLGAQNKDYGAASETLLTKVELRLRRRRRIVPFNITLRRARSGKGGCGGKNGAGAFLASLLTERVLYRWSLEQTPIQAALEQARGSAP